MKFARLTGYMLVRFSKSPCLWLTLSCLLVSVIAKPTIADNPPASQFICPAALAGEIDRVLQRPDYQRSYWGILVQPLHSSQSLYGLNENKFFIPASNGKLLTSAAALLTFKPDYRLKTPILAQGTPPHLETLAVVGQGDPTITSEKLEILARQLREKGIRQIDRLAGVEGLFPRSSPDPTWEWEDVFFSYAVAPASLMLNENAVSLEVLPGQTGQPLQLQWSDSLAARQWRIDNQTTTAPSATPNSIEIQGTLGDPTLHLTGSLAIDAKDDFHLAIPDPSRYFLDRMREILEKAGIEVKSTAIVPQAQGQELLALESEPLSYIVQKVNSESHNLFAETLLQLLGGTEARKQRLTELGIDADGYSLWDGSGLSRQNLATPATFVQVLQRMAEIPSYRDSLAIAGVRGTLSERFQNTAVQGRLQGKTGTLTGVVALSGYLDSPQYDPLVFSIIVNHSDRSSTLLRQGIDDIILLLGRLKRC